MIAVGGKDAWREYRKSGGVVIILQWVEIPTGIAGEPETIEPCMLIRAARNSFGRGVWVIPLAELWRYREVSIMVQQARKCANHIGLGDGMFDTIKVLDAIHDHIDDLKNMPPAPQGLKKPIRIGEAKLRMNGQVIAEKTVLASGHLQ